MGFWPFNNTKKDKTKHKSIGANQFNFNIGPAVLPGGELATEGEDNLFTVSELTEPELAASEQNANNTSKYGNGIDKTGQTQSADDTVADPFFSVDGQSDLMAITDWSRLGPDALTTEPSTTAAVQPVVNADDENDTSFFSLSAEAPEGDAFGSALTASAPDTLATGPLAIDPLAIDHASDDTIDLDAFSTLTSQLTGDKPFTDAEESNPFELNPFAAYSDEADQSPTTLDSAEQAYPPLADASAELVSSALPSLVPFSSDLPEDGDTRSLGNGNASADNTADMTFASLEQIENMTFPWSQTDDSTPLPSANSPDEHTPASNLQGNLPDPLPDQTANYTPSVITMNQLDNTARQQATDHKSSVDNAQMQSGLNAIFPQMTLRSGPDLFGDLSAPVNFMETKTETATDTATETVLPTNDHTAFAAASPAPLEAPTEELPTWSLPPDFAADTEQIELAIEDDREQTNEAETPPVEDATPSDMDETVASLLSSLGGSPHAETFAIEPAEATLPENTPEDKTPDTQAAMPALDTALTLPAAAPNAEQPLLATGFIALSPVYDLATPSETPEVTPEPTPPAAEHAAEQVETYAQALVFETAIEETPVMSLAEAQPEAHVVMFAFEREDDPRLADSPLLMQAKQTHIELTLLVNSYFSSAAVG
jgi:hypothetical protein